MRAMILKDIVSNSSAPAQSDMSLYDALKQMKEDQVSSVVIINERFIPIGIFTEHDTLRTFGKGDLYDTTLEQVMTQGVFSLNCNTPLHDAYIIMEEKRYRHIVVVNDDGTYLGVVSEGDFIRHMGFEHLAKHKQVLDAMNGTPLVIEKDQTIAYASEQMRKWHKDCVVIIDHKVPVGLVSERDIAQCFIQGGKEPGTSIIDLARTDMRIVSGSTSLQDAAVIMQEHGVHQIIVVDDKEHFIGLVDRHNVLKTIHGSYFEFLIETIESKSKALVEFEAKELELSKQKELANRMMLKFKTLFEALPDGCAVLDVETKSVEFNGAVCHMLGYTPEEFLQLRVSDYEALQSSEEIEGRAKQIIENGWASFETKHRRKNGSLIDVWVNVVAIRLEGVPHFLAIYRDITERKRQKIELERKSAFLQTILATIPDLIWIKDIDGNYLMANPMFERLYGVSEAELLGKNDFDFVDPKLAQFFRDNDQKALDSGVPRSNEEYLVFADGSYEGMFDTIKTPMKDINGNVIGVVGIARDISERKRKEDEISQLQSMAHIGTWEWDIKEDRFSGSDEAFQIFGLEPQDGLKLEQILGLFIPEDREKVRYQLLQASKESSSLGSTYRIILPSGAMRWIQTHTEIRHDAKGNPIKAIGLFQDITERKENEEAIKRKDEDLNKAQSLAHIGSWRLDVQNNTLEWSDETYRIFGVEKGEILSYESFLRVIHPDDKEKVDYAWKEALQGKPYYIEHRIVLDGKTEWIAEQAHLQFDENGKLLAGVGTAQVITERKQHEEELRHLANHDALTGLSNRTFLLSYLEQAIPKSLRNGTTLALLLFDLDRFKDVNDSFGHHAGDELLIQVSKRVKERLRDDDLIARLGGDEFAIILENVEDPEDAGRVAEELIEILEQSYRLGAGIEVHIGASAGIVLCPMHGKQGQDLLQYADAALYRSKAEGRGTYRYYTDDLTNAARRRVECEIYLRRAIENKEFEVFYQPQVHIASGRIVGAEALIRWHDPQRGLVSPAQFIPMAEDTGLIGQIGEWVLNEVCHQGKIWMDKGYRLTLAVNLSPHQLRHQDVPKMVEHALKSSGYSANKLELELTESALMQREEEAVSMLHSLRAQGVRLAIDDFGTGYSSLSYLKRFPIDVLKIDKSFVDDIPYETDDMAIVSAIIAMGKALGFQVLAEGTERKEQIDFLEEKGCTLYQGYFKSPPVPAAEFEKLLDL